MDYPERFTNTIDALVSAFFDGTLMSGHCSRCAVGNICASVMADDLEEEIELFLGSHQLCDEPESAWSYLFIGNRKMRSFDTFYQGPVKKLIERTGYSWRQLMRIENAFEENTGWEDTVENQFNGLMAVVDVLCEIEGIDDASSVRARFASHPDLTLT